MVATKFRLGRPRSTSYREDKLVLRQCKINPWITAQEKKSSLDSKKADFIVEDQRKNLCYQIGKGQQESVLRTSTYHDLRNSEKPLLFSDESKFNLHSTEGFFYVRRPTGERLDPRYCQRGIGMGPLHSTNGIMD
ncbi:hypothetical protein Trydic_g6305 [Trypoxylus dichotomus]